MFKILVLKATYNLSDEATELFIRDQLSFREFLGLTFADTVPDARTIWLFAETLKEQDMERHLFDLYNEELFKQGMMVKGGYISIRTRHTLVVSVIQFRKTWKVAAFWCRFARRAFVTSRSLFCSDSATT